MSRQIGLWGIALTTAILGSQAVYADEPCAGGGCPSTTPSLTSCQPIMRTVMRPQWSTETRKIMVTQCAPETRERTYTVTQCVPETRDVQVEFTVMTPETRTRQESYTVEVPRTRNVSEEYQVSVPTWRDVARNYTVSVPVWKDMVQESTVMVSHLETRQGKRQVTRCIPVSETRTVRVDRGQWQSSPAAACPASGCSGSSCSATACSSCDPASGGCSSGGCNSCESGGSCPTACASCPTACASQCTAMTWVSNYVEEQVPVTVMRQQTTEEAFDYQVTVCRPEKRSKTFKTLSYETQNRTATEKVCEFKTETRSRTFAVTECAMEQRTREVQYTEYVPKKQTRTEQVTTFKTISVPKTEQYTVMVPRQVEQEIQVQVCHLVPEQFSSQECDCQAPVQTCSSNGSCLSCR